MKVLSDLDALDDETNCINVVIETARKSRTKLAYDPDRATFVVKMVLPQGMSFPFDFGFIPSTRGGDGYPLDVLVLMDEPVPAGTIVPSRLVGVIEAVQTEKDGTSETNDRLIAVAATHDLYSKVKKLTDVPRAVTDQVELQRVPSSRSEEIAAARTAYEAVSAIHARIVICIDSR